jgi:replication factor A1
MRSGFTMKPEEIIQQILTQRPEITQERLLARLSAARDMTGGLIADASLLRMIAAELGIEVPREDGTFKPRLSLGHMVAGLNNVTVTGRIVAVYPVKTFEGEKSGKLASLTIADNDGTIRVVLWNEKAAYVESGELKTGQIVKFSHGYTKRDRYGMPELHIGERSQIDLSPQNVRDEDYPSISKFVTKIGQITLDQKNINIEGNTTAVFPASSFIRSDQTAGKVLRFKLADDTGEVTAVAWNEKADEIESKLKRGSAVSIVNARVKPSQNGEPEVHVDTSTCINITEPALCLIKLAALSEDSNDVCVAGEIASLPITRDVRTSKGEIVKLSAFELKDETGLVRVTAWREHAETASKLLMGQKIVLENVYARRNYEGKIELSTKASTTIKQV